MGMFGETSSQATAYYFSSELRTLLVIKTSGIKMCPSRVSALINPRLSQHKRRIGRTMVLAKTSSKQKCVKIKVISLAIRIKRK